MSARGKRTLAVLQPGYLPWLGFFDQLKRSDCFIFYDDVQYDKNGWRNRNRIKSTTGEPYWLTVPVRVHSLSQQLIETEIDNRQPWARKHLGTIRQFYAKAPHLDRYLPELEHVLSKNWERLCDLDLAVIKLMCDWLGLERWTMRSSELAIAGDRSARLVNFCLHVGANNYLSGNAAQEYLDVELFARHGITVEWQNYKHPTYPQQNGAFVRFLSALDLLFNCGDESRRIISEGSKDTR